MSPESTLERPRVARALESRSRRSVLARRVRSVPRWLLSPPGLATLVAALFIAISVAWVLYDDRVPAWDMGRHLSNALFFREQVLSGDLFAWWRLETTPIYPPLVYLVGIAGMLVGGVNMEAPVIALNVLGVPLLAVACYRVATIAFDWRAGVLAVLFVLGSPMVIGLFHEFILDVTQAAFIAATVWLLLETERFSRPGISVLAGLVAGAALLTKQSSVFFIVPLIAVLVVRGGLRDWQRAVQAQAALPLLRMPACVSLFAVVALLIALPWYLEHSARLGEVAEAVTPMQGDTAPSRLSFGNLASYFWMLVNNQLFLPLAVFFVIGVGHAAVRWPRTRGPNDYTPELIIGVVGSFLIVALWFGFHDARYTLPAIVYVAAIAVGWVVSVRRPIRLVATAVLVGVFMINTLAINVGVAGPVRISTGVTPDRAVHNGLPSELVVLDNYGHFVGPPQKGGEVLDVIRAAAEDGVWVVGYEESTVHLNRDGMGALAALAPISLHTPHRSGPWPMLNQYRGGEYNPALFGDGGIYLVHRPLGSPWPEPCRKLPGDQLREQGGLYVFRGPPGGIDDSGRLIDPRFENLYCPSP